MFRYFEVSTFVARERREAAAVGRKGRVKGMRGRGGERGGNEIMVCEGRKIINRTTASSR
jgi:hypothetical protein